MLGTLKITFVERMFLILPNDVFNYNFVLIWLLHCLWGLVSIDNIIILTGCSDSFSHYWSKAKKHGHRYGHRTRHWCTHGGSTILDVSIYLVVSHCAVSNPSVGHVSNTALSWSVCASYVRSDSGILCSNDLKWISYILRFSTFT